MEKSEVKLGRRTRLRNCPPGLFLFNGHLGFKTEYGAMEGERFGPEVRWRVGNRSDVYVVESGERFWGGAKSADEIENLMVQPVRLAPTP